MITHGLSQLITIFLLSNAYSLHPKVNENYTLIIPSQNCKFTEVQLEKTLDFHLIKSHCYITPHWKDLRVEMSFNGIEPDLFENLSNIKSLQASYLNSSNVLLRSYNLQKINLCKNRINTFKLIVYKKLSSLDLSHNEFMKISLVPNQPGKTTLENLNLSHNNIQEIDSISTFENLRFIDLSWNELKKLPKNIFVRLKRLKSINLSHNQIGTLPPCLICEQENLEYLDLSHNNIKTISGLFSQQFNSIKVVNLEENPMEVSRNVMMSLLKNFLSLNEITTPHEKLKCSPENEYIFRSKSSCFQALFSSKVCCASKVMSLSKRSVSNSHFHATINNKKMAHNVTAIASKSNVTNGENQKIPNEFFEKLHNLNMKNVNKSLNATLERIDLGVSDLEKQYSNILKKLNTDMNIVNSKLNGLNETFNDIFLEISNLKGDNESPEKTDEIKNNDEDIIYLLKLCLFLLLISVFLAIVTIVINLRRSRVPEECTMGLLNLESVDHH